MLTLKIQFCLKWDNTRTFCTFFSLIFTWTFVLKSVNIMPHHLKCESSCESHFPKKRGRNAENDSPTLIIAK